jgi:hypothetical protein
MAYGVTGMTLGKDVQGVLPSRIVIQVPIGCLHIPEGQKQPFWPGLPQLIPDAEGLGQFSLPHQDAAKVDRRFSAGLVKRQRGTQVRGAIMQLTRCPGDFSLLRQQCRQRLPVLSFPTLQAEHLERRCLLPASPVLIHAPELLASFGAGWIGHQHLLKQRDSWFIPPQSTIGQG